jgi:exodeoxyribonuclease VII large subunit
MTIPFDFDRKPPPPPPKPEDQEPKILTVAQLDREIRLSLEGAFERPVLVEGEVAGARAAPSGHVYFTLKDEEYEASIDVVVYRSSLTPRSRSLLVDGARVRLRGKPTFWEPRGRLQLVCDRVAPAGKGAILEALERLKEKLDKEGLFDPARKRPLPAEPRVVGVVSSASGAVIHDICKVAFRRGGARILLASAQVQGQGAADSVRRALSLLQRVRDVDVILIARGGGSSEDLMAFNDEALVRAVAKCRVPVVSAVGHEVDVTLVDFAADARAATPSQAAEMVVPDARARMNLLAERRARMSRAMHARLARSDADLARLSRKLGDPRLAIASAQQRLDERVLRLRRSMDRALHARRESSARLRERLGAVHPSAVIARHRARVAQLGMRVIVAIRARLQHGNGKLHAAAARLDALSPLKVLARGYAIATRADGRALRSAEDVAPGDPIEVRLHEGSISAEVRSRRP